MTVSIIPIKKTVANHDIQNMIETEHAKIKAQAYNDGKNDGMKVPAQPLAHKDKLFHHIHFKSRYESLAFKVLQIIQPISQLAEGKRYKMSADAHSEKLAVEFNSLENQVSILKREQEGYDPSEIASRIKKTHYIGFGIFIGEAFLNTKAFQVMGDSLLSCLFISASVSVVIGLGAHFAGRQYKDAKTKAKRWTVVIVSAIGMGIISSVIASMRTMFQHHLGVDVNPSYFAVFNFMFFLIAAFSTWYYHPFQEEIEQNRESLKKFNLIKKLTKEKENKQSEIYEHEKVKNEKLATYTRAIMEAEYALERIKIMYRESVDEYKKANRMGRKDFSDCFNDKIPPLDIQNVNFESITNKYKPNENNTLYSAL